MHVTLSVKTGCFRQPLLLSCVVWNCCSPPCLFLFDLPQTLLCTPQRSPSDTNPRRRAEEVSPALSPCHLSQPTAAIWKRSGWMRSSGALGVCRGILDEFSYFHFTSFISWLCVAVPLGSSETLTNLCIYTVFADWLISVTGRMKVE